MRLTGGTMERSLVVALGGFAFGDKRRTTIIIVDSIFDDTRHQWRRPVHGLVLIIIIGRHEGGRGGMDGEDGLLGQVERDRKIAATLRSGKNCMRNWRLVFGCSNQGQTPDTPGTPDPAGISASHQPRYRTGTGGREIRSKIAAPEKTPSIR